MKRVEIWTMAGGAGYASGVPRSRLGKRIGQLAADDLLRLNRSLRVFLGLAR